MVKYIVILLLILFLIYMLVWTFRLRSHTKRQNKMNRIRELREKKEGKIQAKQEKPAEVIQEKKPDDKPDISAANKPDKKANKKQKKLAANDLENSAKESNMKKQEKEIPENTKDYWVNLQELKACTTDREKEKCYHYFETVEEGFHGLLLEIYDYGLVRMDELETIAYGKNSFENVDLSFLDELDEETPVTNEVMDAVKELDEKDPGITDIKGTLSEGVEKVIKAVDKEKELEAKKNEPITIKEEQSVEKARSDRAKTSNQEIRNKIFLKWDHYVDDLYEIVEIKASDDTKHKIKKALRDYGYNDVDVLLKSPE